ncbi:MAG: helix-turn-helix domain-containing protein [Aquificae bacterium]|nr:helix-turn-helix domain-containing protein [Aquificota bacterium]
MSGKEIRNLRHALGMTQLEFALFLGTDPSLVSKWENEVVEPKATTKLLLRIVKTLLEEGYPIQKIYCQN